MDSSYGCDICSHRLEFDCINWITSSFGVCDECYDRLSEKDKEKLEIEYE